VEETQGHTNSRIKVGEFRLRFLYAETNQKMHTAIYSSKKFLLYKCTQF